MNSFNLYITVNNTLLNLVVFSHLFRLKMCSTSVDSYLTSEFYFSYAVNKKFSKKALCPALQNSIKEFSIKLLNYSIYIYSKTFLKFSTLCSY